MKPKGLFLTFALSFLTLSSAVASTTDSRNILLTAENATQNLSLTAIKTTQVVDVEEVADTCSYTRVVGTRQECGYVGGGETTCESRRVCDRGGDGRRECEVVDDCSTSSGHYECRTVDDYETYYEPCTRYVRHTRTVELYKTLANIQVVTENPSRLALQEKLKVSLTGDDVSVTATDSTGDALLLTEVIQTPSEPQNGLMNLSVLVKIKAVPLAPWKALLAGGLQSLKSTKAGITFATHNILDLSWITFKAEVEKQRFLIGDKRVARQTWKASELVAAQQDGKMLWSPSWRDLGWKPSSGKYELSVRMEFDADQKILNSKRLGKTTSSSKIKLKY